jgi:putative nucleotidyltransferase with HDIG domain
MLSLRTYLQTRIARRVFGLFFLCAVVPTVTLAASGYWLVAKELESQAGVQLSQGSKISRTLLIARLHAADEELAMVKQAIESRRDWSASGSRLRAVALVNEGKADQAVFGDPPNNLPVLPSSTEDHLARGRVALVTGESEASSRIYLVRNLSSPGSSGARLWAEVSPAFLWGEGESETLAPPGVNVYVYAGSVPVPLYRSPGSIIPQLPAAPRRPSRSNEVVERQGRELVATSSVFLAYEFSAEPWTIVLQQPVISGPAMQEFRRTVILTCITGLLLVVFAGNVLLRQRLDPVARLREGTRRLAAGDFAAQVDVATGDEFQDLAASFNSMAAGLRDQFALLEALQQVDREALRARSATAIIETARDRMRELTARRCDVSIVIARRTPEGALLTWWRSSPAGGLERAEARASISALDEWQGRAPAFEVEGRGSGTKILDAFGIATEGRLILPLLERGVCFGGFVLNPVPGESWAFTPQDIGRMRQLVDQTALALSHQLSIERLHEMSWSTLEALARTIDANSPWTAGHSERVTRLSMAIGRRMGLAEEEIDRLHRGGLLHDVGKIGIPAAILEKPGALAPEEMALVREHPVVGARILEPIHAFADVIGIVRHHHERLDGHGYPDGIGGYDIPLLARVAAVADVYDALVSHRPYRAAWDVDRAIRHIADSAGSHFDPVVVRAFLALADSSEWAEATSASRAQRRQPLVGVSA